MRLCRNLKGQQKCNSSSHLYNQFKILNFILFEFHEKLFHWLLKITLKNMTSNHQCYFCVCSLYVYELDWIANLLTGIMLPPVNECCEILSFEFFISQPFVPTIKSFERQSKDNSPISMISISDAQWKNLSTPKTFTFLGRARLKKIIGISIFDREVSSPVLKVWKLLVLLIFFCYLCSTS